MSGPSIYSAHLLRSNSSTMSLSLSDWVSAASSSAKRALSCTVTNLRVFMCVRRAAVTQKNRHDMGLFLKKCTIACVSTHISSCLFECRLSYIREEVESAWLPELHTAFTHFAHSYVPLILQWWSVAVFSETYQLWRGREKDYSPAFHFLFFFWW